MIPASDGRGEDREGDPQAGGQSCSSSSSSSRRRSGHTAHGTKAATDAVAAAAAAVAAAGGFGGDGRERVVSFSGGPVAAAAPAAVAVAQGVSEDDNFLRDMNFNGLVLRLKPDGLLYLDVRGLTCTVGREKAFKGKMARELRYVDTYYKNAETGAMKAISNREEFPAIANRLPALCSEDEAGGGAHPRASRRKRAAADRKLRRDKGRRRRNYVTSVFLPLLRFVAVNSLAACCLIKKHVQVSRTRSASAAAAAAAADAGEASSSDDDETSHPDAAAAMPSAASPSGSSQQQQQQQQPTSEEVCRAYLEKTVFFNALHASPLFEHALVKRSLLEYYHDIVACAEAAMPPPCGYQSSSSGGDGKDADAFEEQSPLFEAARSLWQTEEGTGGVVGGSQPCCVACEAQDVPYPCPITSCDHTFCWNCVVQSGLGEGAMACPECGKPLVLPPLYAIHEHELGLVGDAASSTDASMETDSAPTSSAGPSPAGGAAAAAATAKLQYFCKDCKMRLNSFRQAQIHVNGQRHWDQVQRLRERSMRCGKEYESAGLHVFEGDGTPVPERRKAKRNRGSKKRLVVADESDATTG